MPPPMLRKTTSKIPSVAESFRKILETQVKRYKLTERIDKVYNDILVGEQWTDKTAKEYEAIEERMQRAVKHADKTCRKVRRGKIPFSPLQKKLMGAVTVLRQIRLCFVLNKGKSNRPRTKYIKRLSKKYGYTGQLSFDTLKDIDIALVNATKEYGEFNIRSSDCRWDYINNIARELDEIDRKGRQHHFKVLQQRELTKEYFRRIKKSEGEATKGGVDRIQFEDEGGEARIIFDKTAIEQEIMCVNESKLLQANDTPLRSSELSILLGEQGDYEKWETILRKQVQLPSDVDEDVQMWYAYITQVEKHTAADFTWTTYEYIHSWKKMKEETSTLPGIQVAHIKCLDPDTDAANVMSKLALIPLMVGYSPKNWRNGIDSMIPKKVADLRPAKLRLILLLDARFNHNNKLIGKKMMEYGEKHSLLAPEQYGSRKEKSSIDHSTNKRITMDIIRQSGTPAIYIANDAKSCYDRIILMVAYLTMRNFGVPSHVAISTVETILNMKHFVRTKYGDSENFYGGEK